MPVEQLVEAIKHGVRKINIDTDLRLASTGAMRRMMAEQPVNLIRVNSLPRLLMQ